MRKKIKKDLIVDKKDNEISRREAMSKMSLAALSAATMLLLLNKPENVQAQPGSDPGEVPEF